MDFGLFSGSGPKLSRRRWRILLRRRLVHVIIVALNLLEGGIKSSQLHLLGRRPNAVQRQIHRRLMALVATCDAPGLLDFPLVPGRSGPEFIARLQQLEHFAERSSLLDLKAYAAGPKDFEKISAGRTKPEDAVDAAVQPYTSLNSDRLRLVGKGEWDLQAYLTDELWLPYVEPLVLRHGLPLDYGLGPNFKREDPAEYLKLAKKWSSLGLLALVKDPPPQETFTRIFNARKNEEVDRQIGDRRLANQAEYAIRGPSQFLPGGYLITNLHVPPGTVCFGAVTDRKDFYHQSRVSFERAASNVTPFGFPQSCFADDPALHALVHRHCKTATNRSKTGDRLGMKPRSLLSPDELVYPAFSSLLQGDHLGVEFALSAHEELLSQAGLLRPSSRIKGHAPFPAGLQFEGLVIDDYFSLSIEKIGSNGGNSRAVQDLQVATKKYDAEGVLGSPEKDVLGSRHFKVVGAEVDCSPRTCSLGLKTVGAPLQKRISMAVLSLRAARLPVVSSALASRLAGNWTSIFMYRRCLASLLQEIYAFGVEDAEPATDVYLLPRSTAQELVLSSVFSFLAISDVSVQYHSRVFATDASLGMGAVVSRPISEKVAKALWLGGDKKGAYTKLDSPIHELARAVGVADEDDAVQQPCVEPRHGLDFSFDFLEVCAGCGSVSKALARRGYAVCQPIELSDSPHFDVCDLRLIEWICFMLRTGRLKALMVEPVCTTFSPAAHPAVRSYKEPKGFDRTCPKTLLGNIVAFRCIFLLWYASIFDRPCIGEQPRLSKMGWLPVWKFLVDFKGFIEAVVASCQFGSIHRKEFKLLTWGIDAQKLERKCPGGHDHVLIQGAYTKESAVYVPALAEHFADAFELALRRRRHAAQNDMQVAGIESVVSNDLLVSGSWSVDFAWRWRSPSHINILESHAYLAVLKKLALEGGGVRFTTLLDSRVAKCSHAKGRSSSRALTPTLKKGAAWQLAGGLYPALGFAPTRLNTADGPSRERDIGETDCICLSDLLPLETLQKVHSLNLSRNAAAWLRITLLLLWLPQVDACGVLPFGLSCKSSGLIIALAFCLLGLSLFGFCFGFCNGLSWLGLCPCLFDPQRFTVCGLPRWNFRLCIGFCLWISLLSASHLVDFPSGSILCPIIGVTGIANRINKGKVTVHVPQPLPLACVILHASAMPLMPVGSEEHQRAARRARVSIAADRAVRPQTRNRRDVLLGQFDDWLRPNAEVTLEELIESREIDPEQISNLLVEYGKELFYAGKSYGRFSETINGVCARRPVLKRQLASAWNLAFAWVADEPHFHHPAMPLTILISFSTLALLWGWPREAALLMMAWSGLLRIGEVFAARRKDLVLPKDGPPGVEFALLQIHQPKTRGVSAKHQAARIDPQDVVQLLAAVYGRSGADEHLWNRSPGAFRRRFGVLQKALGLPTIRTSTDVPYDLASLRPGGATYLLHRFEDAELVRRRGRWLSTRVCEIYLQEAAVITHATKLSAAVQTQISKLVATYPEVHRRAIYFLESSIPPNAWPRLW